MKTVRHVVKSKIILLRRKEGEEGDGMLWI